MDDGLGGGGKGGEKGDENGVWVAATPTLQQLVVAQRRSVSMCATRGRVVRRVLRGRMV